MAHRVGGQAVEFMVAIGDAADVNGLAASAGPVANDPNRKSTLVQRPLDML